MSDCIYSVASGRIFPFSKACMDAARLMSEQDGFYGVNVVPDGRTLFFYKTRQEAVRARNTAKANGMVTGRNICRFRICEDGVPEFDDEVGGDE